MTHKERVALIDVDSELSLSRQAKLLEISRSSLYLKPTTDEEEIETMNLVDKIYTKSPFFGSRRIKRELEDHNIHIGRDQIRRLMRAMGLEAIYPKKRFNTSLSDSSHKKYPYLLSGIVASRPNHIWGTDITYVRLEEGWAYLNAIIDWFSRYVITWELSAILENSFCVSSLNRALKTAVPDIHNSDQGVQYTAGNYTGILETNNVRISMDGRGRCFDNIFTERLWRTIKYENIYLKSYRNIDEANDGLKDYFKFYNAQRKHQSLDYKTPAEIYFKK